MQKASFLAELGEVAKPERYCPIRLSQSRSSLGSQAKTIELLLLRMVVAVYVLRPRRNVA